MKNFLKNYDPLATGGHAITFAFGVPAIAVSLSLCVKLVLGI